MEYLYWLFKQLCHFLNITDKYLGNAWNKEDHTFTAGMVCTQVLNDLSQARCHKTSQISRADRQGVLMLWLILVSLENHKFLLSCLIKINKPIQSVSD